MKSHVYFKKYQTMVFAVLNELFSVAETEMFRWLDLSESDDYVTIIAVLSCTSIKFEIEQDIYSYNVV